MFLTEHPLLNKFCVRKLFSFLCPYFCSLKQNSVNVSIFFAYFQTATFAREVDVWLAKIDPIAHA